MTREEAIAVADALMDMKDVLDDTGWHYRGVPGQTPCPIHKAGGETRASARLYEDGLFCYTCGRQYWPTEIYAAINQIDRYAAAQRLLEKFPPEKDEVQRVLKDFTTPKKKETPKALADYLESHLRRFRHRTGLANYREWARRTDEFVQTLAVISPVEQMLKLQYFKNQLHRALDRGMG
jgi:hypothetical protein